MTDDCTMCGARWNRTSISAQRPRCTCGERVCPKCYQAWCFGCNMPMHTKCAVTVAENDYCESCGEAALKQSMLDDLAELPVGELQRVCLLAKSTTEELLIASLAIAEHRKKSA